MSDFIITNNNRHLTFTYFTEFVLLPEVGWLGTCSQYGDCGINVVQATIAGTTLCCSLLVNKGKKRARL